MHPANPMLPERHQPRPQPDRPQQHRQASTPAPVLSIDPLDIPVGQAITFEGHTFVWDGGQFRNELVDRVIRSEWRRQLIRFLIALAVCGLATWWVMSGLDWDTMTLDERAPYKLVGRIAVFVLIGALIRLLHSTPESQARRVDQTIRAREGIKPTEITYLG